MDLELRNITDEERNPFVISISRAFGEIETENTLETWGSMFELDRTLVAEDGGRFVANGAAWTQTLTVPGGKQVPMCGVTAIGVSATHRRQGLLTKMMNQFHAQAREREEAIAGLSASESGIYTRFGYGSATRETRVEIDAHRAKPSASYSAAGDIRFLEPENAFETIKAIREKYAAAQVGEASRSEAHLRIGLNDTPDFRGSRGVLELIVHSDPDGNDDGYLTYRRSDSFNAARLADGSLHVLDKAWLSEAALNDMWRFILDIDLTEKVTSSRFGPLDSTLHHTLVDPRQIHITNAADLLWLAILDVPVALAARTYEVSDKLVITVPMSDGTTQTVELEGSPEGASCKTTSASADVTIPQRWLGSMYLGDQSALALGSAGLIEGEHSKLERLSRLFKTPRLPYCGWEF